MSFSQIIIVMGVSMSCLICMSEFVFYSMWKIFVLFVFLAFAVFIKESSNKLWGLGVGLVSLNEDKMLPAAHVADHDW